MVPYHGSGHFQKRIIQDVFFAAHGVEADVFSPELMYIYTNIKKDTTHTVPLYMYVTYGMYIANYKTYPQE